MVETLHNVRCWNDDCFARKPEAVNNIRMNKENDRWSIWCLLCGSSEIFDTHEAYQNHIRKYSKLRGIGSVSTGEAQRDEDLLGVDFGGSAKNVRNTGGGGSSGGGSPEERRRRLSEEEKLLREKRRLLKMRRLFEEKARTGEEKKRFIEDYKERWKNLIEEEKKLGESKKPLLKTGIKLPQTYTDYIKGTLPAIYFSVAGLVISALTGNAGFFFSSLFFGFYYLVPNPENIASSSKAAKKLKESFNDEISKAKTKDQIDEITKRYETLTNIERLLEEADKEHDHSALGVRIPAYASSLLFTRGLLKGFGVVTLVWTLIAMSGVIPLSGLIGLVIGFAAYFTFKPQRKEVKE